MSLTRVQAAEQRRVITPEQLRKLMTDRSLLPDDEVWSFFTGRMSVITDEMSPNSAKRRAANEGLHLAFELWQRELISQDVFKDSYEAMKTYLKKKPCLEEKPCL